MKLHFWLLDINEEIVEGQAEIRLWGLDERGQRVLVLDKHLRPYFYLILDGTRTPSEVATTVKAAASSSIERIEPVERRFFGNPVDALKITLRNPALMNKCVGTLAKLPGVKEHLEDDLRYSYRYLVDNHVTPCSWHEIDVKESEPIPGTRIDKVYEAVSSPTNLASAEPPPLRVLAFSIICYSPKGAPRPERSPVAIVSCATNLGKNRQFIAENLDDKTSLKTFIDYLRDFDPDVVASYGGNSFEWPFLLKRANQLRIALDVDRTLSQPHTSTYGHVSVTGRTNLDLADFADEIGEVKVKTLENIATFLKIPEATGEPIEEVDYPTYWEDKLRRRELLAYSDRKARMVLGVAKGMLDFAEQLSSLSGLPLDQVGTAAVGFRTESYLIREAYQEGELIPKRVERPYFPYQGAIVLKPKPGLHEDVVVFDFKSMYPNLMINYNISPDTYVDPKEHLPEDQVYTAPEVDHRFRKTPPGLYRKVLSQLIQARDRVRTELREQRPGTTEYELLDARQRAIKVMTNATYGYAGWIGARWYVRPVAEAAAAWGRQVIAKTIQLAESLGLEVIYGDTDSIFIRAPQTKADEFQKKAEAKFGLEIKPDEVYRRIFFTEAKKRYAGLLNDGALNIVGLEVARGDWSEVAKKTQEEVLGILLREESAEKAAKHVQERILNLRAGYVPYKDLIIWKTLTKEPTEYAVKAPHVEAAKRLAAKGWEVSAGDKVGFVVVRGKGKLYERAMPYAFASLKDVDLTYYEEQQILPAVLRILESFKVTEAMLIPPVSRGLV